MDRQGKAKRFNYSSRPPEGREYIGGTSAQTAVIDRGIADC